MKFLSLISLTILFAAVQSSTVDAAPKLKETQQGVVPAPAPAPSPVSDGIFGESCTCTCVWDNGVDNPTTMSVWSWTNNCPSFDGEDCYERPGSTKTGHYQNCHDHDSQATN